MRRKCVARVLVASLVLSIGCYSTNMVTKEDLKGKVGEADIIVFTKDLSQYTFSKEDYRVHGDTLSGAAVRKRIMGDEVALKASIALSDIGLIEAREVSPVKTILACGGFGLVVAVVTSLFFSHARNV